MNKICPSCQSKHEYTLNFCPECGSRLVDEPSFLNPLIDLGDANAIGGGLNIDQSKSITSNDTHYHTTTVEHTKSDSELKLESENKLRETAQKFLSERGRIDSMALSKLRLIASQLGISDERFKIIVKEVRSLSKGISAGLSTANVRYVTQAQNALATNNMTELESLLPRLEAISQISSNDDVQFLYHLSLCILCPEKIISNFENQMEENYWRTVWTIIAYIRGGNFNTAASLLAQLEPHRFDKPEEDIIVLEAFFNNIRGNNDAAQDFLDEILGEPSPALMPLLRAIEASVYQEAPDTQDVRFYLDNTLKTDHKSSDSKQKKMIATRKGDYTEEDRQDGSNSEEPKDSTEASPLDKSKSSKKAPLSEAKEKSDDFGKKLYEEACVANGRKKVMLLQKAAEAGNLDAQYDLSDCYEEGNGVEKNEEYAIQLLKDAADKGHVLSSLAIGGCYMLGMCGQPQDYVLAEKYLLYAAENNIIDAQAFLAGLFMEMEEYDRAIIWAKKAARCENEFAERVLGESYWHGKGVEPNQEEGLSWLEKASQHGDEAASCFLGYIYGDTDSSYFDAKKSFTNFRISAEKGHKEAYMPLALCYKEGVGTRKSEKKAQEFLQKAYEAGDPDAIAVIDGEARDQQPAQENLDVENVCSPEPRATVADVRFSTDGVKRLFLNFSSTISGMKSRKLNVRVEWYIGKKMMDFSCSTINRVRSDKTIFKNNSFAILESALRLVHNVNSKVTARILFVQAGDYNLYSNRPLQTSNIISKFDYKVTVNCHYNIFSKNKFKVV